MQDKILLNQSLNLTFRRYFGDIFTYAYERSTQLDLIIK